MCDIFLKVTRHQLNLGELAEPWLVSHVFVEVVLTDQAKVPLATCAVVAACLHQLKHGEGGTDALMSINDVMPCAQQLQQLVFPLSSCQKVSVLQSNRNYSKLFY